MPAQSADSLVDNFIAGGQLTDKKPIKGLQLVIVIVAIAMLLFQFVFYYFMTLSDIQFKDIHYAFILTLSFLVAMRTHPKLRWIWASLIVVSLVSCTYIYLYEDALQLRAGMPKGLDVPIGIALVAVAIIATWRTWGIAIPLMSLAFIVFAFTQQFLPPPLYGASPTISRMVTMLSIGLGGGMWGTLLDTSANIIFYFMIFGSIFEVTGAVRWFDEIGKLIGRISKAGPAQTAVVTSALFGVTSGSVTANVVTSGIFTIPAMKRAGYSAERASAIEATSSVGGQIMPPIMGTTAFIMAAVIAVPYPEIAARALIPALFFFLCCGLQVELMARKYRTTVADEAIDMREVILLAPLFFIPMGILVYLLFNGHSVAYSTGPTIVSMIALSMLRKSTRPTLRSLVDSLTQGAERSAAIGVTCASMAPIVVLTTYTGLGIKLPGLVHVLSGGMSLVALALTAVVAIIVGLGAPTSVTYLLVAIIIAPSLVKMGIPLLAAHMFAFYYGVLGSISPPVAMASLVAAKMGEADYWKTSMECMKLAVVAFFVPFLFCYNPALLGFFTNPVSDIMSLAMTCVIIFILSVVLVRWYLTTLSFLETVVGLASALCIGWYVCTYDSTLLGAGLGLFALLTFWQIRKRKVLSKLSLEAQAIQT